VNSGTSHQLSATALLPSPDGPPLPRPHELFQFREDHSDADGHGIFDCFFACRRKLEQGLARRRVMSRESADAAKFD
jgi:hypothetical protein